MALTVLALTLLQSELKSPMPGFNEIDLSPLRHPFAYYDNLLYHRNFILEGIRLIAFRNANHMNDIMERPRVKSASNEADEAQLIQEEMLKDQSLDKQRSDISPFLLQRITYGPMELYLALLYAEIEFYREYGEQNKILKDNEFERHLEKISDVIPQIKGFRDAFLHPSRDYVPALEKILALRGRSATMKLMPEMNKRIDEYLRRIRQNLEKEARLLLHALPQEQRIACIQRILLNSVEKMRIYKDQRGGEHSLRQIRSLWTDYPQVKKQPWEPKSQRENEAYEKLIDYFKIIDLSSPEQTYRAYEKRQTPFEMDHMFPFLFGGSPPKKVKINSKNRLLRHIGQKASFYHQIMLVIGTLDNETYFSTDSLEMQGVKTRQEILNPIKKIPPKEFRKLIPTGVENFDPQRNNEAIAPARVAFALLYEPLKAYVRTVRIQPELSKNIPDTFTSEETIKKIARHRNAIFHVVKPSDSPFSSDFDWGGDIPESLARDRLPTIVGLAGFFYEISLSSQA